MERYTTSEDDGTEWKECLICFEMRSNVHTDYAHTKAKEEAASVAHKAAIKATEGITDEFIDYYMMFYRKVYSKEYDTLFDKYRNEFEASLHRKYAMSKEEDICSYHHESILWLK
jgi:hypothetical protein